MTTVKGSAIRLRLEWGGPNGDTATGPDGMVYSLQSEHVRGERRAWWFDSAHLPQEDKKLLSACPYGYISTKTDARRVAEWLAWARAGRESQ